MFCSVVLETDQSKQTGQKSICKEKYTCLGTDIKCGKSFLTSKQENEINLFVDTVHLQYRILLGARNSSNAGESMLE